MKLNFRLILFPFTVLYALIMELRNFMYDKRILKSEQFEVPVINVGNLSVGGTGKTPQIEHLIRLLQKNYKIAVISRGYKRKTKGFIVADESSTPETIGDEPYQIFHKFDPIIVAVGEDRVKAIRKVLAKFHPDVILLDDAFQHRRVQAGLNLLLTPYQTPFFNDFVLPAGNLRECRKNAKRADLVVVTKSSDELTDHQRDLYRKKIHLYTDAPVFFSHIVYDDKIYNNKSIFLLHELTSYEVLLVTGIANPHPLYSFLSEKNINFDSLKFGDHHYFSKEDVKHIKKVFEKINNEKKIILTTEKDFVRLHRHFEKDLYYLPIQTEIFENEVFNNKILDYVSNKK